MYEYDVIINASTETTQQAAELQNSVFWPRVAVEQLSISERCKDSLIVIFTMIEILTMTPVMSVTVNIFNL